MSLFYDLVVTLWLNFLSTNIVFAQLGRIEVLEVRFATPPEVVQQVHLLHSKNIAFFLVISLQIMCINHSKNQSAIIGVIC